MKKWRFAVIVFLCGIAIWGCSRQKEKVPVRIGYPPIIASLPYYIAQEKALFNQAGLDIKGNEIGNSNEMLNALIAGQLDVLPAVSLIPVIHLEIKSPGKIRLFSHSRMTSEKAFDSIVVPEKSPIADIKGLSGKKIGVFPGTSATNLLKAFLSKNGIDISKIQFVSLAPPSQITSLASGAIDALYSYEPVTTIANKSGYRKLFGSVYAALQERNPVGCSVINREFEKKHPDEAQKSIQVIDDAVRYMRDHEQEAKTLLPKYIKITPEIAVETNVVDVTLSSEVDQKSLQQFIDLLYEIGEIPERIDAQRLL